MIFGGVARCSSMRAAVKTRKLIGKDPCPVACAVLAAGLHHNLPDLYLVHVHRYRSMAVRCCGWRRSLCRFPPSFHKKSLLPTMAPNLAAFQHRLIGDMIQFRTCQTSTLFNLASKEHGREEGRPGRRVPNMSLVGRLQQTGAFLPPVR